MGTVYARGNKLWISYIDEAGERRWKATGCSVGQEPDAQKILDILETQIAAGAGLKVEGPLTVEKFAEKWTEERKRRGIASAGDDGARIRIHAMPTIGKLLLVDVRPKQIRALIAELRLRMGREKGSMAPRSVRHVYSVLHRMFEDAVADELVPVNPVVLKRGELPARVDKDPTWRSGAVYTRAELEQLISDERLPEYNRTTYATLFLTGMRPGEVSALRWRAYDTKAEPLGRFNAAVAYSTRQKVEKGTKTERPREVPVHPTLAKILAAWKLSGWARMVGRQPSPDDLILPSAWSYTKEGGPESGRGRLNLNHNALLAQLHLDLDALQLRRRRCYDTRRTFISLAQADGARKDILRWVTHGPTGDIMDVYTTLPWHTLCEEVVKLKVELRSGKLLSMPQAVGARKPAESGGTVTKSVTASVTVPKNRRNHATFKVPEEGIEPSWA